MYVYVHVYMQRMCICNACVYATHVYMQLMRICNACVYVTHVHVRVQVCVCVCMRVYVVMELFAQVAFVRTCA